MKFEIEKQKEGRRAARGRSTSSDVPKHPVVKSREDEASRLEYLMWGGGELSRNVFDFQEYLRMKYKISHLFDCNYPPGDTFAGWHGFNDGFGVVVETKTKLPADVFAKFVQDLEKRFSRKLTLVKTRGDNIIEYCFTLSMPNQGPLAQSKAAVGQRTTINERSITMKQATTAVTMHLGKGTRVDWAKENEVFAQMLVKHGIRKFHVQMANPYCVEMSIPFSENENSVRNFANDLFHVLDVLDADYELDFGQLTDCSGLDLNEDARCYYVLFNHHDVKECHPGDAMYKYKLEVYESGGEVDEENADVEEPEDGELTPAQIMKYIADGIKSGAIRSKSGEGYFVLKGEFFDAIKAGRKTTEYRDLTPRNLSKSIGIKTVKLQRGYGHPGQPPEQMRFEVSSVGLLDSDDRECDPYNIPGDFIATTIAIHLGKRIG